MTGRGVRRCDPVDIDQPLLERRPTNHGIVLEIAPPEEAGPHLRQARRLLAPCRGRAAQARPWRRVNAATAGRHTSSGPSSVRALTICRPADGPGRRPPCR